MADDTTTKELQVLDEMGKEVRQITKFEQTVEDLKGIVAESAKIIVTDLEDENQLAVAKAKRIELRKIEIAIEKRGKGYRDVFNAVNKEIISKEGELKAITSPEIARLSAIEEEAEALALKKKREAMLPVRKERLLALDASGVYVPVDEKLLELDADGFEKYFNECTADKNEKARIKLEEEAEARRKEEEERLAKERADFEAEKKAEADRKAKEAEDAKKAEEERVAQEKESRKASLPARKERLATIGDQVPVSDDVLLGMDDNQFDSYFNKRVADKNTADKQAIEDKKKAEADAKAEAERKEAEAKAQKEKEEAEARAKAEAEAEAEKKRKAELEKREAYTKFLKEHGWTPETRDQFETRETATGYELWKKVGVFNK